MARWEDPGLYVSATRSSRGRSTTGSDTELIPFTATLPPHQRTTIGLFHVNLVREFRAGEHPLVPVFYGAFERAQTATLAPL